MKRRLITLFTSLTLVAVLLVTLCGCSTYGSIKGNFEDANYKEIEISEEYKNTVAEFVGKDYADKVTIHVLQKQAEEGSGLLGQLNKAAIAIIVEFKADQDLVDSLAKKYGKENVENAYDELQKVDTINGNCVLVLATDPSAAKLFKS